MFVHVCLGALGAALIVSRGAIFRLPRKWLKFLSCSQCVGFWLGIAIGKYFLDWPFALLCGCATSALGLLVGLQYPPIEIKRKGDDNGIRKPPIR